MRLFRAKKLFANGAGFVYEGQIFMVDDILKLPHPAAQAFSECYEEIVSPNVLFPLKKFIKLIAIE